jgi:hypothetical protein
MILKGTSMAKPIVVSWSGTESSFDHTKVDRKRLYGERRRIPLDKDEQQCSRAALTTDGQYLLRAGMTGQGYFDEAGRWIPKSELVGLDKEGSPVELVPATLGVAQSVEKIPHGAGSLCNKAEFVEIDAVEVVLGYGDAGR